jgi:uncharacterized RDD family membrane protein YckC
MPDCLECDSPIDPAFPGGLCPKCLVRLGVDNSAVFGMEAGGSKPSVPAHPVSFGPYRILHLLGKGGMGSVYEVEHEETGRRLALKVLGQAIGSEELRARFIREGRLAAAIRHPHVVGVFAAEEIEGVPVIAMELLSQGSLADQVTRDGPLPPAKAVDAVLQIIDGLEAAQASGILHRDVKPANCFVNAEGQVKVGDFGLSISTFAKNEASLTQSGASMGTPSFAAPEQLRGDALDGRADIYSVGATLYFLLTGRPAHAADNLGALIAAVLTKSPADPSTLQPGIPAPLARVVMRCLERDKTRRPKTYESLRAALLPFSSEAPPPALVGLRFIAGVVDLFLASLLSKIPAMVVMKGDWLESRNLLWTAEWAWSSAVIVAYFALTEHRWGATPGKLLCGLQVRRACGDLPDLRAACLRASVLLLLPAAPDLLFSSNEPALSWIDLVALLLFIGLFFSMRPRNGYAALHDLASRTRVVKASEELAGEDHAIPMSEAPARGTGESIGPFSVLARHGRLIEAWDPSLNRMVWLLRQESGAAPLTTGRRGLDRPARLRWLQSVKREGEHWEAYEAPAGQPLATFACGNQSWRRVRRWLLDLSQEFHASLLQGESLTVGGFDRVWITTQGQAIWLDFPLPSGGVGRDIPISDHGDFQDWLAAIGGLSLAPAPPLHASRLMEDLAARNLKSADEIVARLIAATARVGALTWRRRLLSIALWPALALAFALLNVLPLQGDLAEATIWMHTTHSSVPPATHASLHAKLVQDLSSGFRPAVFVISILMAILITIGTAVSLIWTLATGVPPGLQLFGLVLMDRNGRPASRLKVLTRAFVNCLCMLALAANLVFMAILVLDFPSVSAASRGLSPLARETMTLLWDGCALGFLVPLVIAVHACIRPQRSFVDLMLGTTIVPR